MCWYTIVSVYSLPRVAPKGGIKVYKITDLCNQNCKPCDIIKCKSFKPLIYNEHFIYFKDKENPSVAIKPVRCEMGSCITEGYHSYIDKDSMGIVDEKSRVIGEFLIPEDTKYYLNENGEVVSEKLIFKRYIPYKDGRLEEKTFHFKDFLDKIFGYMK